MDKEKGKGRDGKEISQIFIFKTCYFALKNFDFCSKNACVRHINVGSIF